MDFAVSQERARTRLSELPIVARDIEHNPLIRVYGFEDFRRCLFHRKANSPFTSLNDGSYDGVFPSVIHMRAAMFRFLTGSKRRTSRHSSIRSVDSLEKRTLLSHGHVPTEVAPTQMAPQKAQTADFSGTWTMLNPSFAVLKIVQDGRRVTAEFDYAVISNPFSLQGKVTGTKLHLSGKGTFVEPHSVVTANIALTDPKHFEGTSTLKVSGSPKEHVQWAAFLP